ncbi:hypothetical protein AAC387_Pa07g1403 [Persea americana]
MPLLQNQFIFVELILLFVPSCFASSESSSSYYYNRCAPSTCGDSLLHFPLGLDQLCRSANITTSCENGSVFMINDQIPEIKYKILDKLNETVYARKSFRLVDTSLFGCGPVPAFYGGFSQRWLILGSLSTSNAYRTGTFFNCTEKPQSDILARLMAAPCLECGETKNWCYFYNGFTDPIPNCRPFTSSIPNELFNNLSGVGNLRRALQVGFEAEWDSVCGVACMDVTGGRCGFMDEHERTLGKELCFCSSGVHRQNCSDGTSIAKRDSRTFGRTRVKLLAGIALGLAFMFGFVCFAYIRRRKMLKNKMELRGKDEQALRHHLDSRTTTSTSIETFLLDYASGMPTRFSYKQIKKYSNNFRHKLGQGGFGSVFKAEFPNNCTVAIKILDENEQSEIQFLNEGSNGGGSKWHKCEGEEEENIARRMELVGLWCIQYSPSRRPTMRNVINMLQGEVSIDIPPLPFKGNALQRAAINYNPTDNCDDVS